MRSRIDNIEKNDTFNKKQIQEFDKKIKAMCNILDSWGEGKDFLDKLEGNIEDVLTLRKDLKEFQDLFILKE